MEQGGEKMNEQNSKAQNAIQALSNAIDNVTKTVTEKLVSVETRIVSLKQSIEAKNNLLKEGIVDLVRQIDSAANEAETLHAKIDAIESSIATLPKIPAPPPPITKLAHIPGRTEVPKDERNMK
jgi:flagellar capping protein FliD